MRWTVLALCTALSLTSLPLSATAQAAIDSGGIGLTRAAWEEIHGPGVQVETVNAFFDELFTYEDGRYTVAFSDTKPGGEADALVLFLEVAWTVAVPEEEALRAWMALLPTDAERIGTPFVGPSTPAGPMDLYIALYASPSLATVPYGPDSTLHPDVLVASHGLTSRTYTGHQFLDERTVTVVTLMTSFPTG